MGARTEYTFRKVSITTEPTQLFTWAALQASPAPDEGSTIPTTFVNIPQVEIIRTYGDAKFFIADGDVTVTGVTISSSGFNDPLPQDIDLRVISRETVSPTAGAAGVAVSWPFYATLDDVKDKILSIKAAYGTDGDLTDEVMTNQISLAYSDLHAAAGIGGYQVPLENTDITTLTAGQAVSAVPVALGISDISKLAAGDVAFLHGAGGAAFNAEYVSIVNVDTTAKTAVALSVRNAYDSGVTIEKCTEAWKAFRQCNSIAAAKGALNSMVVGQPIGRNEKVQNFVDFLDRCLKGLMDGTLTLTGLSKKSGFIKTFQTENPDASDVKHGSVWALDMPG